MQPIVPKSKMQLIKRTSSCSYGVAKQRAQSFKSGNSKFSSVEGKSSHKSNYRNKSGETGKKSSHSRGSYGKSQGKARLSSNNSAKGASTVDGDRTRVDLSN